MRLGKSERKALDFSMRVLIEKEGDFSKSWHTYSKDADTKRIIYNLVKKGLVEIYLKGLPGDMFRITPQGSIIARQLSQKTRPNPTRRMSKSKRRELMYRFLGAEQAEKIMDFGEKQRREQRAFDSGMREIKRLRARGNPTPREYLEIERDLLRRARLLGLTGERKKAYVYGTLQRIRKSDKG